MGDHRVEIISILNLFVTEIQINVHFPIDSIRNHSMPRYCVTTRF